MTERRRVVVYLSEAEYRDLRAKLILCGKTVSGWFREKVSELLDFDDYEKDS